MSQVALFTSKHGSLGSIRLQLESEHSDTVVQSDVFFELHALLGSRNTHTHTHAHTHTLTGGITEAAKKMPDEIRMTASIGTRRS